MTRDKILQEIASTHSLVRWQIENLGLAKVDFAKANLEKTRFVGCRLDEASFAGANLNGARFERCRLREASFDGADVKGATFLRCVGLDAARIAQLEQAGAIVQEPRAAASPLLWVLAIAVLVAVAAFVGRGYFGAAQTTPTPSATPSVALTDEQLQQQADQAAVAGNWSEAIAAFEQLLPRRPNDIPAHLRYLELLRSGERFKELVFAAQKALALRPTLDKQVVIRLQLAEALVRSGDKVNGVALFNKLIEEAKDDASAHRAALLGMGNALWKAGATAEALAAFADLLQLSEPEARGGVWLNIALIHGDAGNEPQEIAALKKVLTEPRTPAQVRADARIHLGLIELRHNRVNQAVALIEQAGREGGDAGQLLNSLQQAAEAQKKNGNLPGALSIYRLAVRLTAASPAASNGAKIYLANLLVEMKQPEEALALYREVAAGSPDPVQKKWAADTVLEIESQITPAPTP